ncbi:MAG: bifunctional DNA-formamidopyrimidine glycosylase/DNA-(apurinic or apyrimidinic site) lyase [Dermatophilaceae bacterium]
MPELPEVEVVRRGLETHVSGRVIAEIELRGARVARRHLAGPEDLRQRMTGRRVSAACRRGKYLWFDLGESLGLLLHLGMSGQLLVADPGSPEPRHLHARFRFVDGGSELRFVDQRTFGGLALTDLAPDGIPEAIAHIAPDLLEPAFARAAVVQRMWMRDSAVKRVLLDQTVASGIGNIYADEALWRARVHGERPASRLSRPQLGVILDHAGDVMREALAQGGTSFDALYVNVNGASGYFDRSLAAYGQAGRPCQRCGVPIRREAFMNRSSYSCPRCQPRPRTRRGSLVGPVRSVTAR